MDSFEIDNIFNGRRKIRIEQQSFAIICAHKLMCFAVVKLRQLTEREGGGGESSSYCSSYCFLLNVIVPCRQTFTKPRKRKRKRTVKSILVHSFHTYYPQIHNIHRHTDTHTVRSTHIIISMSNSNIKISHRIKGIH